MVLNHISSCICALHTHTGAFYFSAAVGSSNIDENVAKTLEDLTKNMQGLGVSVIYFYMHLK